MRIILLHLTIMSLSVIEFTMARQMFLKLPEDEVARPGESVTLKCVIDQLKGTCFWRLGGQVKAVQKFEATGNSSGKYAWRNAGSGDCSLTIARVIPDDEGIWTCDVGRSSDRLDDSLRADIYLSIGENCVSGYPCSKPAGRLTGRPARFTPKTWKVSKPAVLQADVVTHLERYCQRANIGGGPRNPQLQWHRQFIHFMRDCSINITTIPMISLGDEGDAEALVFIIRR